MIWTKMYDNNDGENFDDEEITADDEEITADDTR